MTRHRWLLVLIVLLAPSVQAQDVAEDAGPLSATVGVPAHAPAEVDGLVLSQVLGIRDLSDPGGTGTSGDRRRTALWDWPLVGTPPVVKTFDPPAKRWLPGHRGIDLAGVAGEQVLSVDAGVVTFSGQVAGVGVVSVTHDSGLRSTYQPVEDRVTKGERVSRGQHLGTLDTVGSHCVLRDCLHLGAVRGRDAYVDPLPLLLGVELTLLPVDG